MRNPFIGLYSILIGAVACSGASSPVCTLELRPAVAVYVKDSLTRAGVASGASLVVREGSYKDSVSFPNSTPGLDNSALIAAGERSGTYQVTVLKPGYAAWLQSNVRVTSNECHVNTVNLTALLQPAS
jgi:hypothetical protein